MRLLEQGACRSLRSRSGGGRVRLERSATATTPARRFQHRAQLYQALDARLHSKTRFFGAACVTNRVLAHWASADSALVRTGLCAGWLSELGAALETVNRAIAEGVYQGTLAGPALDEQIIFIEQSAVERSLIDARAAQACANLRVLPALDALLNDASWLAALHFSPAVRWYRRVLAGVRRELNSPIEFARQGHREQIGRALISALRRDS